MTSLILIIFLILLNIQMNYAAAIEPVYLNSKPPALILENGVLKGNISASKDVPEEFYGTWSVSSKMISTNDPYLFNDKGNDIWVFDRSGEIITLTNPVTGATASITVDEVKNKTVSFSRQKDAKNYKEYEKPKITLDGNFFSGTDVLVIEQYRNGELIKTSKVEYEIKGIRLAGPTTNELFGR